MKKQVLFTILAMLVSVSAFSHDIEVANADGVTIYYNYSSDGTELAVIFRGSEYDSYSNEYQGNVVIPEEVTYMNRTRKVTSIGGSAFYDCSGLTSITIPNSVTSIGNGAFAGCSGLTSVTIGNSVTSIGHNAFNSCSGLTSVIIPNSVTSIGGGAFAYFSGLTSVTIPNCVTSISYSAFRNCSGLTSVTIPNSVTSIESYAFRDCSGLTSVTIGNSVTSIGDVAFYGCSGLTSVTIPNSVTSIGEWAFSGCFSLTSVTIPNSVTSIGNYAFSDCSKLTSVTIGNSVTSIGQRAFDGADIPTVVSLIENPSKINGKTSSYRTFSPNTFLNATLYVPKGTIGKYKATEGWKDFVFIEEGTGGGDTPEPQKCATPTITYENGKLKFSCETEDVTFCYSVTPPSQFNGEGNDVNLSTKYTISVYAKKEGYENSETVTKEIEVGGMMGDMNGDGVLSVTDVGILITNILEAE